MARTASQAAMVRHGWAAVKPPRRYSSALMRILHRRADHDGRHGAASPRALDDDLPFTSDAPSQRRPRPSFAGAPGDGRRCRDTDHSDTGEVADARKGEARTRWAARRVRHARARAA